MLHDIIDYSINFCTQNSIFNYVMKINELLIIFLRQSIITSAFKNYKKWTKKRHNFSFNFLKTDIVKKIFIKVCEVFFS